MTSLKHNDTIATQLRRLLAEVASHWRGSSDDEEAALRAQYLQLLHLAEEWEVNDWDKEVFLTPVEELPDRYMPEWYLKNRVW